MSDTGALSGPDPVGHLPGRTKPLRSVGRSVRAAAALGITAAPGLTALYTALTLATGALPVATAWLTKVLLDSLVDPADSPSLIVVGVGLTAVGTAAAVTPHVARYLRQEAARRVGLRAQDRLFAALNGHTGLGRFESPRFLDRLRLALQAGGTKPNELLDSLLGATRALITVTGFLGVLMLIGPLMPALVLIAGIPVLIAEMALSRRRARVYWSVGPIERREFFYMQLMSTVAAAKEVRLFGIGDLLRGRMLDNRREVNAEKRELDTREARVQSGLGLMAAVVPGLGLLWVITAARAGRLSVGDVTVFVAAVAGVQTAVAMLAGEIARAYQSLLLFEHYVAVTTAGPDLPVAVPPTALPPLRHGIELRGVWFRYSDEHCWILRDVELTIPAGGSLALVGLNGAGKSTLIKLLCRFYDPTRGAILWDGVDIRDVEVSQLRERISATFQDFVQYEMTAAENISLGDAKAQGDTARVRAAAHRAGIHPVLEQLPDGYETLLSRMFFHEPDDDNPAPGVMLSGGQWQRLAVARAFIREKRDLVILDEPSAGLDAEAEYEVHTSLRRYREGQTCVLISHRLNTVRDADRIVVLSDGRIVEQGDHEKLMAAGGRYAQLFTLQAAGYRQQASKVLKPIGER
ncbi:ABC transporter ATP-binding protein [Streptomyces sp. CHD11]|uniref:ABC transporter ATP-binding protein n=1 Tax=Streptomyces sp. CHD11 TaxID=2741325 RepID=UPI001BFC99C6|nr:ABC transporter ATP-binding protein [Streptomyces sp. CHD11]MBT3154272.1 ABC transporter ATP-binding protein [Streptomyces sp. CHD11]